MVRVSKNRNPSQNRKNRQNLRSHHFQILISNSRKPAPHQAPQIHTLINFLSSFPRKANEAEVRQVRAGYPRSAGVSVDRQLSPVSGLNTAQDLHERGFSRPAGAQKTDKLAGPYLQGDPIQDALALGASSEALAYLLGSKPHRLKCHRPPLRFSHFQEPQRILFTSSARAAPRLRCSSGARWTQSRPALA